MHSQSQPSRKRRTEHQWQNIVDQFHRSGLTAGQFCTEQGYAYATFCKWRLRLARPAGLVPPVPPTPAFLDLGALAQPVDHRQPGPATH